MERLKRTEALGFHLKNTISLPNYHEDQIPIKPPLINPLKILNHMQNVQINQEEILYWKTGRPLHISQERMNLYKPKRNGISHKNDSFILILSNEDNLIGVGELRKETYIIKPKIDFNAAG